MVRKGPESLQPTLDGPEIALWPHGVGPNRPKHRPLRGPPKPEVVPTPLDVSKIALLPLGGAPKAQRNKPPTPSDEPEIVLHPHGEALKHP